MSLVTVMTVMSLLTMIGQFFLGISLVTMISVSSHVYGVLADCNVLHEFLSDVVDILSSCDQ